MKRGNVVTGTNHLNQVPGTLARNQNTFWYYSDELEHDISTERLDLIFQGERHSVLGAVGFFYQPQEIVAFVGDCVVSRS